MKFIQKVIDYRDQNVAVEIANTSPGDYVLRGGAVVLQTFNGTTPTIDVGFKSDNQGGTADPDALASLLAAGALGNVPLDELATATNKVCTVNDTITATFKVASGTPTQGKALVWAEIINAHPVLVK